MLHPVASLPDAADLPRLRLPHLVVVVLRAHDSVGDLMQDGVLDFRTCGSQAVAHRQVDALLGVPAHAGPGRRQVETEGPSFGKRSGGGVAGHQAMRDRLHVPESAFNPRRVFDCVDAPIGNPPSVSVIIPHLGMLGPKSCHFPPHFRTIRTTEPHHGTDGRRPPGKVGSDILLPTCHPMHLPSNYIRRPSRFDRIG